MIFPIPVCFWYQLQTIPGMPSSVIAHINYDAFSKTLKIIFLSGSEYNYLDVPQVVFNALKKSASKGTYLNKHIKGHYNYQKIK